MFFFITCSVRGGGGGGAWEAIADMARRSCKKKHVYFAEHTATPKSSARQIVAPEQAEEFQGNLVDHATEENFVALSDADR